jgi:hypothetical protein
MKPGQKHPCDRSELGHLIKTYTNQVSEAENRLKTLKE